MINSWAPLGSEIAIRAIYNAAWPIDGIAGMAAQVCSVWELLVACLLDNQATTTHPRLLLDYCPPSSLNNCPSQKPQCINIKQARPIILSVTNCSSASNQNNHSANNQHNTTTVAVVVTIIITITIHLTRSPEVKLMDRHWHIH